MQYINFNGQLIPEDQPVVKASSRWLLYGEAVFESLRVFDGKMPFLGDHVNQLELSINQLELEPKQHFTTLFFEHEIDKLLKHNNLSNAAVNIFIFSEKSEGKGSSNNEAGFFITSRALPAAQYEWKQFGLKAGVYQQIHHPQHELAGLNTTNRLVAAKASKCAQKSKLDDVLIVNTSDRPIMFTNGGLLLYLENKLLFPVYSEGALPNILREYLLPMANRMNIDHQPAEITMEMIKNAGEIMRVDEITGVDFVAELGNKKYHHDLALKFHESLNQMIANF